MKIGILFNRITWEIKQLIKEFDNPDFRLSGNTAESLAEHDRK